MSKIYLGGSRSLPPSAAGLIGSVVGAALQAGHWLAVGCSAGADQAVIQAVIRSSSFSHLRIQAAFAASGAGSWSGSAVSAVRQFAAAGGSVSWLAGGALSVPLAGRLIRRSLAGLAGCSAAVFFSPGPGSLAVAGAAVKRGVPVFAFSPSAPSAPRGCPGAWVQSSFLGFACWSFQPAAIQARLF